MESLNQLHWSVYTSYLFVSLKNTPPPRDWFGFHGLLERFLPWYEFSYLLIFQSQRIVQNGPLDVNKKITFSKISIYRDRLCRTKLTNTATNNNQSDQNKVEILRHPDLLVYYMWMESISSFTLSDL